MCIRLMGLGALLVTLTASAPARAVDEGDWQLSAAPAFAVLIAERRATPGLGGRLEGRYGLRDDSAAWLAVASSWHPRSGETVRASVASGGFTLAFNVLRIIPFLEAGAAVADVRGALTRSRALGVLAAAGGEYLFDRRWSAALVGRFHYLPVRLGGADLADPGVVTVEVRVGRTF